MKKCPNCFSVVKDEDTKCSQCGHSFEKQKKLKMLLGMALVIIISTSLCYILRTSKILNRGSAVSVKEKQIASGSMVDVAKEDLVEKYGRPVQILPIAGWRPVTVMDYFDQCATLAEDAMKKCVLNVKELSKAINGNVMLVEEDFTGDGTKDKAAFVINNAGDLRLYGFINMNDGNFEWMLVEDLGMNIKNFSEPQFFFVKKADPVTKQTYCSQFPQDCTKGEPKSLNLKRPAFSYGLFGATERVYYWNSRDRFFETAQIAD